MTAEIDLCDLVLLKVDRGAGCSVTSLALRQRAVLADLTRLLPRLAALQFGELDARVIPDLQVYRMRLLLRPRQRSLLLDPRTSRPTLEGEAAMLREDIEKVGLRVVRAARAVAGSKSNAVAPDDLMRDMLVRRARQDWRFMVEHGQLELPFPDCPRFVDDVVPHRIDGIVHAVTEHGMFMRNADIWTIDANPRIAARMGRICIGLSQEILTTPTQGALEVKLCGQRNSQVVRLSRCALTSAIVGAVPSSLGEAAGFLGRPILLDPI